LDATLDNMHPKAYVLIMNTLQKTASFQSTKDQTEQKVMVQLLSEIEKNPSVTQRNLAAESGIALGLMNGYLKRCVKKGWVRVSQVSPSRIAYFLTPEGLKEKSRMVKDYLGRSLTFFRDAKNQCEHVFLDCQGQGWTKIALVGDSDLTEIAKLVALRVGVEVILEDYHSNLFKYDAVLITDITTPQDTYDDLVSRIESQKILTLELLHVSRKSSFEENVK
jgi:DNA-binding MarR family transcriptional regulator